MTNSSKKGKSELYLGLNKVDRSVNVLDAITEFSTNTSAYLKPSEIECIVNSLNKDDYIEVLRKYLTHVKKNNKNIF